MGVGPRTPVNPPMAGAPRFGLLASASPAPRDEGARWTTGIAYEPEGCVEGATLDPCEPTNISASTKPGIVEWEPYILTVTEECSVFSSREERAERVRRLLTMDTERQLGAELWDGGIGSTALLSDGSTPWPNTWLANVADVDILSESGPVGLVHGLACLEQYLASNNGGQQGMIHATAQTLTHWASFSLLRREGNRILTFLDTVVVVSPGYSGNNPDGAIGDDNVWAYATDMVTVRLTPIDVPAEDEFTIDRENNTIGVTAARMALAEWERCRHAGVRLAMDLCDVGGS